MGILSFLFFFLSIYYKKMSDEENEEEEQKEEFKALELYRNSTLGRALQATLEEMQNNYQMPKELCDEINAEFDRNMTKLIHESSINAKKAHATCHTDFRGDCSVFRLCDSNWWFRLKDVTFRMGNNLTVKVDGVNVTAVDGKISELKGK